MDMEVDTKVLDFIQKDLRACQKALLNAAGNLSNAVALAGQSLEGRQYSLSQQETNASCQIVDASAENLSILEDYISRLETDVNEYLKCKYTG